MATKDRGIFFLRVVLGLSLLFAGLDKFFMWASGQAFTSGGFLAKATGGSWLGSTGVVNPTHDFWVSISQNAGLVSAIDTLVVFGEVAIGAALILGLATRFSAVMGVILMALLYVANWSFANGPFNEQFMYLAIAATIAYVGAGAYALDTAVEKLPIVQRIPVVKVVIG